MSAATAIREWREDPAKMVWDLFGATPDAWQAEALQAFADPATRRIAMQACAGPGKSTVLAWCGWNFMLCYADKDQHPNGAAVSITGENLRTGLWKELALWRNKAPVLQQAFEQTGDAIVSRQYPKTWFLSARSFPKKANAEEVGATLSGLHSPFMLYLIDESGGIHPAIGRAAEQGLSNCRWGKILQAGNPLSFDSLLYASVTKLRNQWRVIRITGDPDDAMRSQRIDLAWAREQVAAYGRDNPWVMVYILGKFPPSAINALLSPDEVAAAAARKPREHEYSFAPKVLGGDFARFGDDRSSFCLRQGIYTHPFTVLRNARTEELGGRIIRAHREPGWHACFVDNAMGGGVIDYCRLLEYDIVGVDFGGKATDPRYANKRTEMAFTAAEYIKTVGALPADPEFDQEATAHTYSFNSRGQLIIEPKEQVKAKIGRSTDKWDSYLLTHAAPVYVEERFDSPLAGLLQSVGKVVTERPEE